VFPDDALLLPVVASLLLLAAVLTGMPGILLHWPREAWAGAVAVLSCAPFQGWNGTLVFPDDELLLVVVAPLLLPLGVPPPTGMPGILLQLPQEGRAGTVALSCAMSSQKSVHCPRADWAQALTAVSPDWLGKKPAPVTVELASAVGTWAVLAWAVLAWAGAVMAAACPR
jgi:hypothetical protein